MSLKLAAMFLLTAALETGFIDAARPDYQYLPSTRAWYKFHTEHMTWAVAGDRCRSEGALLFHPDDDNELRQVIDGLSVPLHHWLHTGLSDLDEFKKYKTVDGRPLEQVFHKWEGGQPAYGSSHGWHCGHLRLSNFELYIGNCDWTHPFICKEDRAATASSEKADNTIANLTAKIAELEVQLANRTAVLEADENQIAALEFLTANQTAALKDKRKEERTVEALERISKVDENQATILERLIQTVQGQAVNQTAIMERLAVAVEAMAKYEQQ